MRLSKVLFLFLLFGTFTIQAQEDSLQVKKTLKDYVSFRGYLKEMQTVSFGDLDTMLLDNLLHNRLNFKIYPTDKITVGVEMRNRAIFGNSVTLNPNYGKLIGHDNGIIDMSWTIVDKNSFVLHSTIDRLYVNYARDRWEARLGRQRINWGIALAWNPNDLFNTYNYIDFDYEERPGVDAARFQYYFKDGMRSLDVAYKPSKFENQSVGALMYKFNKWNYDIQVLGGLYYTDYSVGLGWAGNIKNAGFKGEASYFQPKEKLDTTGVVVTTMAWDYSFKNSTYVNVSLLYNSNGINDVSSPMSSLNLFGNLTAKTLMPTKYSGFVQYMYTVNPLSSISFAAMYGYGLDLLLFMPSYSYSLKQNVDMYLVGQLFFMDTGNQWQGVGNSIFFRLKWSF